MSDRRAGLRDWPHRETSRFLRAGGFAWHVQTMGDTPAADRPVIILLHGTGAATHSWRGLAPALAAHCRVVAMDLPGHGLTEMPASARMSLPGMAAALRSLLQTLEIKPHLVVGHSAGAAIALRMVLDGAIAPRGVVALNGALKPFGGAAGQIFSPLAKLLTGLPVLPGLFAWRARNAGVVAKLLADTGSTIDADGIRLYARLMQDPRHTGAALAMMARWDLRPLVEDLPRLAVPLLLIVGDNDRAIAPAVSEEVARRVPNATIQRMPGLGHLSHEEDPAATAALIQAFAATLPTLMAALYASGDIVLLILAGMAIEAVVLALLYRRTGRGVPPRILLPNLVAGACLVGAAGTALHGAWWGWTGTLLLLGGVLHAVDLRGRWR